MLSAISGNIQHKRWVENFARAGYATKGVVYTIVGVLALQAAFGSGGSPEGSQGAIRSIADEPYGQVLLILTALGLVGYALWRFYEALADPDGKGTDAEGLVKRTGYFISGGTYLLLAFTAVSIVAGWGGGSGGGNSRQSWLSTIFQQPFGQWAVGLAGAIIVGVGLYHFYRAYKAKFLENTNTSSMSPTERTWFERLGRFGLSARGVTFCIIGVFLIQAAIQAQPGEARGLEGALQTLQEQPYGPWLLGIVAAGFVAYGIYCAFVARYRQIGLQGSSR